MNGSSEHFNRMTEYWINENPFVRDLPQKKVTKRILLLSHAIREKSQLRLHEGFLIEPFCDYNGVAMHMRIAVSRERIVEVLQDLISLTEEEVVPLGSQYPDSPYTRSYYKPITDRAVLQSTLYDYEDVLMDDGSSEFGIHDVWQDSEIRLHQERIITVNTRPDYLPAFLGVMRDAEIPYQQNLETIWEHNYEVIFDDRLTNRFLEMKDELGLLDEDEQADEDDYTSQSPV